METIKSYLNNVFGALPQTREILDLKNELLNNMLDKYDELKASGKTENEAIGIVISEFGNIDELLQEMEISVEETVLTPQTKVSQNVLNAEQAAHYIDLKYQVSRLIGRGVSLILLGVALLVGLSALFEAGILLQTVSSNAKDVIPVIILLLMIAPAVGLFIFSGAKLEDYRFIEEGDFELTEEAHAVLAKDYAHKKPEFSRKIVIGVTLCVLSPLVILISSIWGDLASSLGVSVLLLMIAVATYLFIRSGSVTEGYRRLLKLDEYATAHMIETKEQNKVIGAVAGIVWPLATCVFLVAGFVFDKWEICWIVFPITGILFGGFCAFYSILKKKVDA
ncbi:MAG: permease prefix domain 1-containing protein [Cellulosilyticaceae bacterium]